MIMDIHNYIVGLLSYWYQYSLMAPVWATHTTIMDIHNDNSDMDIQNSIVDICHSIMDINIPRTQ